MGKKVDLTGQRFGKLVVVSEVAERDKNKKVLWSCVCDCGNTVIVVTGNLTSGGSTSCGCSRVRNLMGEKYGKLTVVKYIGTDDHNQAIWECRCDCGNVKEVLSTYLINNKTRSCGCLAVARRKSMRGENHPMYKQELRGDGLKGCRYGRLLVMGVIGSDSEFSKHVKLECLCDCGKVANVSRKALISGNTKSCGCLRLGQAGENHPNYNPNLTEEDRLRRHYYIGGGNQRSWSKQVMDRDNYTCQICGDNKGGNLNAHHLNGWNAFPEQRFDLDNGVTLCTDCHKEFHSEYGYGDNTREQFDEYAASKTLVLN